ncbi:hypothetical protein L1049_026716 [Liquidambar formosana]|uniref:Mitochondrial transcription termination factor family protein n=1 Tax=Liquidambar formosana TaxID=63359 RepID=A0AAP0ND72_LIQFO
MEYQPMTVWAFIRSHRIGSTWFNHLSLSDQPVGLVCKTLRQTFNAAFRSIRSSAPLIPFRNGPIEMSLNENIFEIFFLTRSFVNHSFLKICYDNSNQSLPCTISDQSTNGTLLSLSSPLEIASSSALLGEIASSAGGSKHASNPGMLGKSLGSPLLTFDSVTCFCFSMPDVALAAPNIVILNAKSSNGVPANVIKGAWTSIFPSKKWELHSTAQTDGITLSNDDRKIWESCRQALSAFKFSVEEEDKILGKAFGQVHSPYWGEERKKVVPKFEIINEILEYLRSLSLSDDDLCKLLKKFPEVLGCSLEDELRINVQVLEKDWGIKGKSLRNLLLRNPKVLGYNVDCKGDCMAQCTRCWVRF